MSKISAYEVLREENIARNEAFLRSMGIDEQKRKEKKQKEDESKAIPRKRKVREKQPVIQPTRRSTRGQASAFGDISSAVAVEEVVGAPRKKAAVDVLIDESDSERVHVSANSLRNLIVKTNPELMEEISDEQIVHCAHRINSMSNKALGTRIKAIARAAGSKSYEKLLVFYFGLKASHLYNLAALCKVCLDNIGVVL